jgi:hypothetical protein
MKLIASSATVLAMTAILACAANATTCDQRAQNCITKGGSHAACYASSIIEACKKTGIYTAPSGKKWEAKGK